MSDQQMQQQPQHKHHAAVTGVTHFLNSAKHVLAALLTSPELQAIRTRLLNGIDKDLAFLQAITGLYLNNTSGNAPGGVNDVIASLKPLTTVGGEDIGRVQPIDPSLLIIDDNERNRFLRFRDAFAERFRDMTDDEVYKFMREPDGEAVIRSLAKREGHPQWRDAEVNSTFIQQVKDAMKFNAEMKNMTRTIDMTGQAGASAEGHDIDPDADRDEISEEDRALMESLRRAPPQKQDMLVDDLQQQGKEMTEEQKSWLENIANRTPPAGAASEELKASLRAQAGDNDPLARLTEEAPPAGADGQKTQPAAAPGTDTAGAGEKKAIDAEKTPPGAEKKASTVKGKGANDQEAAK
jgi:hypothetical protein